MVDGNLLIKSSVARQWQTNVHMHFASCRPNTPAHVHMYIPSAPWTRSWPPNTHIETCAAPCIITPGSCTVHAPVCSHAVERARGHDCTHADNNELQLKGVPSTHYTISRTFSVIGPLLRNDYKISDIIHCLALAPEEVYMFLLTWDWTLLNFLLANSYSFRGTCSVCVCVCVREREYVCVCVCEKQWNPPAYSSLGYTAYQHQRTMHSWPLLQIMQDSISQWYMYIYVYSS